jgi:hypothetical protein
LHKHQKRGDSRKTPHLLPLFNAEVERMTNEEGASRHREVLSQPECSVKCV